RGPGAGGLRPPVRPVPGPARSRRVRVVSEAHDREPGAVPLPPGPGRTRVSPGSGPGAAGTGRATRSGDAPGAVASAAGPSRAAADGDRPALLRGPVRGPHRRGDGVSRGNGE